MKSIYSSIAFVFLLNGCSVLVGQVKPVEEKASFSASKELPFPSSSWKKLAIPSNTQSDEDTPDAAWQSEKTAAVISINSVCRQSFDDRGDLKRVTRMLLSQWDDLKIESEKPLTVSNFPALETTARGNYLNRDRKFQTVVVKTPTCVYDLVYLSPIQSFTQELSVFQKFRDSLNLK